MWHADRGRLLLQTPGPVPLGLAYVQLVETNPFYELVIFTDYALRIPLGTFSILFNISLRNQCFGGAAVLLRALGVCSVIIYKLLK